MEEQFVSSRPAVGESSGLGMEAWRFSVKKHKGKKGFGCVCVWGGVRFGKWKRSEGFGKDLKDRRETPIFYSSVNAGKTAHLAADCNSQALRISIIIKNKTEPNNNKNPKQTKT